VHSIQDLRDPAADSPEGVDGPPGGEKRVFRHDGGIRELVTVQSAELGESVHPTVPVIYFCSAPKVEASNATAAETPGKGKVASKAAPSVTVEVAFGWSSKYFGENVSGFANGIRTNDGGSHIEGFRSAIAKTLNAHARKVRLSSRLSL
jgi:DNA gyrase subunit B